MSLPLSLDLLTALLLASVRVVAWLLVAPPFAARAVSGPIKALLGTAVVLPLAPGLAADAPPSEPAPFAAALALQVVVGGGLGFLCYVVFVAVQAAGDLIDTTGGFALAMAFDPIAQTQNSVIGRLHGLLAATLLLVTDAWLLVWHGLLRSFELVPLGPDPRGLDLAQLATALTAAMGHMALVAVQIAAPMLAVLFLADVGLGLATRIAPQLNAFATGFPLKILLTITLLGFALTALPEVVTALAERMASAVVQVAS